MASKLPGVYTKEIDLSQTAEDIGGSTGVFVGVARKGIINSQSYFSSPKSLIDMHGIPPKEDTDYGVVGALEYLPVSPVYFTRVSTDDMLYGKVSAGDTAKMASASIDVTPRTIVASAPVSGVAGQKVSSTVISGVTSTDMILTTGATYSPKANVRNSPTYLEDAERELVDTTSLLVFSSIGPDSDSDLIGITVENFETYAVSGTAASVTIGYRYDINKERLGDYVTTYYSGAPAPSAGSAAALDAASAYRFVVTVASTSNISYDQLIASQNFYKTADPLLVVDESTLSLTDADVNGYRYLKPGSTFSVWASVSTGVTVLSKLPATLSLNNYAEMKPYWYAGFDKVSGTGTLTVTSTKYNNGVLVSTCPWYDKYDFVPKSVTTDMTKIGKSGNIWQAVFKVSVYKKEDKYSSFGSAVETFYGTLGDVFADDGTNLNIKNAINGVSKYLYVAIAAEPTDGTVVVPKTIASAVRATLTYNGDIVKPTAYYGISFDPVTLGKGNSGSVTRVGDYQSAYNLYTNKRDVLVDIIVQTKPIKAHANMVDGLISSRLDCRGTVQIGSAPSVSADSIYADDTSFSNVSYVSKYAGWYKKYDSYNRKYRWLPMSIQGAVLQAKCVAQFKTSSAPAGVRRGVLNIEGMYYKFTEAEIERMYVNKNINTAMFINGTGYVMWGQRTALALNSALREIQVRAVLLGIERSVEATLNGYLFEGNTPSERLRVTGNINGIMSSQKGDGNIEDFYVLCDDTNNPPAVVDNQEMNVAIAVTPVRSAEVINLSVIITKTGVTLSEVVG
jgi:hypothetical protein